MSHPTVSWVFVASAEVVEASNTTSSFVPGVDLLLDDQGDLVVTGDLEFSTGLDAVAQGIRLRILTFQEEWFLDLDHGVPYYRDLLGQKFNVTKARDAFRKAIMASPGVTDLIKLNVEFDRATRYLTVDWEVRTTYGVTSDTLDFGV